MIHFVWLGPVALSYTEYLAVKTASVVYKTTPNIWTDSCVPENEWLLKIQEVAEQKLIPDEWFRYINIARMGCASYASDYLRFQILHDFGGMYLDTDTLCIKPIFDLDLQGLVVGRQGGGGSLNALNGAVMYTEDAHHPDIVALLGEIKKLFTESGGNVRWGITGPELVTKVVMAGTEVHTILPKECFYFYDYTEWQKIFEDNPIDERMYVLHYWGNLAKQDKRVKEINEDYVRVSKSVFAALVRQVLG